MYGSQPPSQSYYQTAPPTSYPEWQQTKPTGHGQSWGASQAPSQPATPAPPTTSQPATSFYNPSMYGPMPGAVASPTVDNGSHSHFPPNVPHAPSPSIDTSTWGVRYNQQQGSFHQSTNSQGSQQLAPHPPPLPPRPTSGIGQIPPQPHPAQQPMWNPTQPQPPYYQPSPSPHIPEQQAQTQAPQFWPSYQYQDPNAGTNPSLPPKPPPIPPAYQTVVHQQIPSWPNTQTYSTHSPTHNYDPVQQQPVTPQPPAFPPPQPHPALVQGPVNANEPSNNGTFMQANTTDQPPSAAHVESSPFSPVSTAANPILAPVPTFLSAAPAPTPPPPALASPLSHSTAGASALGIGGPSDWEHFSTGQAEVDDTAMFTFKPSKQPQEKSTFELASENPPATPQQEVSNSGSQPSILSTPVGPTSQMQADRVSPISVVDNKSQQIYRPSTETGRMDSVDSFSSSVSAEDSNGQIDSVIKQWSQPVLGENKLVTEPEKSGSGRPSDSPSVISEEIPDSTSLPALKLRSPPLPDSSNDTSAKTPRASQTLSQSITTISDPYADLDPWYKSSLTRYVTMLRKEMTTESDDEKFKIFTAFLTKESKLREILYNVETGPEPVVKIEPPVVEEVPKKPEPPTNVGPPNDTPQVEEPKPPKLEQLDTDFPIPTEEEDDVITYSPGGRPVLASSLRRKQAAKEGDSNPKQATSNPASNIGVRNRAGTLNAQSSSPIVPGNALSEVPRSVSVPPGRSSMVVPQTFVAYTPFRYQEGPQRGSEPLNFERPAYQAYSALRQASAESGRVMSQPISTPQNDSASLGVQRSLRAEHDETFLGLVRAKSVAFRGKRPVTTPPNKPGTADPFKRGITTAILDDIQKSITAASESARLSPPSPDSQEYKLRAEVENFPDDLAFVEKSLEAWDRGAKSRKEQIDGLRRGRHEESERHIDGLFNDKEIGYSDISVLENEFKQTEAQKQLNEDRKEFEKFVEIVFTRVDERLRTEITSLENLYKDALGLLEADAESKTKPEKVCQSSIMKIAIELFYRIEKRHAKRVEVVLERERRKKQAERRFFVVLGDSAALKRMDKEFEATEKKILLEAAKAQDDRANQILDIFDEACMRGVGQNQSLLDDISDKIDKLDPSLISDGSSLPPQAIAILSSTAGFVGRIGADSEIMLNHFGMADRALNDADYKLAVAEAKVANVNQESFRNLEEQKKTVDRQIENDLEARKSSVRKLNDEVLKRVQRVLKKMQNPSVEPDDDEGEEAEETPVTQPAREATPESSEEQQQQDRLRKALEDAKKRNAAKQPS